MDKPGWIQWNHTYNPYQEHRTLVSSDRNPDQSSVSCCISNGDFIDVVALFKCTIFYSLRFLNFTVV